MTFSFYDIYDRCGNLICPIYRDGIGVNEQECIFDIEIEQNSLSRNEFERFWNHVRSVHPLKYDDIIANCRAQVLTDSMMTKTNKVNILFALDNLDQRESVWIPPGMIRRSFLLAGTFFDV